MIAYNGSLWMIVWERSQGDCSTLYYTISNDGVNWTKGFAPVSAISFLVLENDDIS
jgi:hypothetical protein